MMGEKISTFYNLLNGMEGKEYIETFISYNVALISARLKPSITLNLSKYDNKDIFYLWNMYGKDYLRKLNLGYISLRDSDKSLIVLIYDKELLEKYINKKDNLKFLNCVGYDRELSVEDALNTLKDRYEVYNCPHELGIFLGYPLEDVKDFMECSEKKCLTCGYWKVYNSENKAKTIFTLFDRVKDFTVTNIIEGNRTNSLSLTLKDNFQKNHKIIFD
ncbi:DUF3793 family protein [Clostridium botulinum]|uniref:DUF3793 family protein n=1 Tax=Clostridium botulinum (strain Eklund 17B / Type B) TaxID=935198 RepID=B2TL60_CLOBB|nr:conserved hypothetical protein [Clostridium botulinum B str. Eklund 17B (NRP)]MBY6976579.1 DUF3793 family protein [Clostridium botulinum]MBY7001488.1 DUF3793 family protein [Clostridium botulinum]NFD69004.1 DUF3793 family protein [Clostridium botulinum]NFF32678.1 DUF3793 family protein [Clostridium botulinum]